MSHETTSYHDLVAGHTADKARHRRRRQRLFLLATYRTEGGIHEALDDQDEAERIVRGILNRGQ